MNRKIELESILIEHDLKTDFESIAAITEYPVYNKPDPVAIASH
jgi:hypothetical protein